MGTTARIHRIHRPLTGFTSWRCKQFDDVADEALLRPGHVFCGVAGETPSDLKELAPKDLSRVADVRARIAMGYSRTAT